MKFRLNKKLISLISIVAIGTVIFTQSKYVAKYYSSYNSRAIRSSIQPNICSAREYFRNDLERHENQVWKELEKIDINHATFIETCRTYPQTHTKTKGYSNKRVSAGNQKLIREVLTHFGFDPRQVPIIPCTDSSPAAASDTTIYINEQLFNQLSNPAKKFVVGHEIHHMINKDNAIHAVLNQLLPKKYCDRSSANHPVNKYYRLQEKRADVQTALAGLEWAEGYTVFMQETIKRQGDNPGISHPRNSGRLQLAKSMEEYIKTGRNTHAIQLT